jgi:hypothetical protein
LRVTLRPTIPSDLPHCIAEPLPHRIRCITAELEDGTIIGLGGLGYRAEGIVEVFAQLTDEARRHPIALHRAGLMVMAMLRESGVAKAIATTGESFEAGQRWLLRLGFVEAAEEYQDMPQKRI